MRQERGWDDRMEVNAPPEVMAAYIQEREALLGEILGKEKNIDRLVNDSNDRHSMTKYGSKEQGYLNAIEEARRRKLKLLLIKD